MGCRYLVFFFCKQRTAYEMRISDWSSDVCSSDLSASIKEIARQGHDPLAGPLRVGVIHTIGPYLLPRLVPMQIARTPQMPLLLQENFTLRLVELLRQGEIDCAIMALPLPEAGLVTQPLYDEPFVVAVPRDHEWTQRSEEHTSELQSLMRISYAVFCLKKKKKIS